MAQRSVGQKHTAGETGLLLAKGPQGGLLSSARLSQRALYLRHKEPGHPKVDGRLPGRAAPQAWVRGFSQAADQTFQSFGTL